MKKTRVLIVIGFIFGAMLMRDTRAQQPAPAAISTPTEVVDQIMNLIGNNRDIDAGIGMMQGLKNQPDLREAARAHLIHLRDEQGTYRGYDIAAIQRFSSQFQTVDVLAYYDEQPVLFRFHFYRPKVQDSVKWSVLGFQITTALQEITDVLRDTPVEYVAHGKP